MTVSTIDNCREAPEPLICLITEQSGESEGEREKSVPSSDVAYNIEFMYILCNINQFQSHWRLALI